jgi:two-component system, OmpR family, response regulator
MTASAAAQIYTPWTDVIMHEDIFDRSIDVQVLRLRRKLETDPSAPRVIQTERGVGYIFALPVEPF